MSFSISNIVNKFINVRNKVKTVDGEWVDQVKPKETQYMQDGLGVSISSETIIEVFEVWDKKVIIDTIEFGTDTSAYARLHVRDDATGNYGNQVFHEVNPGGGRANATPAVI